MNALTTSAEPKPRRVPPKIRQVIDLLVSGRARTITAAAKQVGLSRERASRALGEAHCAALLRDKAARAVALSSGRAAARLAQLIDSARSEKVALDASKFSLACAGIKPAADANPNVSIGVAVAGFVIDLRDDPSEPAKPGEIIIGGAAPAALPAPAADK